MWNQLCEIELRLLAEQGYFSSWFRVEGGFARGCSSVVAKPLSRASWKRFAGREEMDGWLCAFPCQYVDKSFWRDVGRREVFSVTSRHGGPKGNENDGFNRGDDPLSFSPLYIYILLSPSVLFFFFFFISILILLRFVLYLAPHRSSILASIDARKINGHVNSFAFFLFFFFETSLPRFIGAFEIKVR